MSSTPVLLPVEEYLNTVYRPDRDYIDGQVVERNMGETPHSRLQTFFSRFFARFEDDSGFETLTEQRLQIGPTRFRIPDVMLARLPNPDLIVHTAPLLCIEVLSSKDTVERVQERVDDYARMGVRCNWVIDPWKRKAFAAGGDGILHHEAGNMTVPGTPIAIAVDAIFAELDRLEKRAAVPGATNTEG
jgi:Uma2 family endonuclease